MNVTKESSLKLFQMLHQYPLYRWYAGEEMRLCVVGDGQSAEEFVDISLQTGQMLHKKIRIDWFLENKDTAKNYLGARPALPEFVSIDEEGAAEEEYYGRLSFWDRYETKLPVGDCRYFYVAAKEDALSEQLAADLHKQIERDCFLAYAKEGKMIVCLGQDTKAQSPDYSQEELNRMAFNTHRIWEGTGNLDYEKAKERFQEPYNYNASVGFVLSIPYKLRSVGIETEDIYEAAGKLSRVILTAKKDPDSKEAAILSTLAYLEHRRWVLEKVTQGVVRLKGQGNTPDYSDCVKRACVKVKDTSGRLLQHPCLVKSTLETPLLTGVFRRKEAWDDPKVSVEGLDDFDRLSVEMHRAMLKGADSLKKNGVELSLHLGKLRKLSEKNPVVTRDFDRYSFCIKNVMGGSKAYARQFETYEKALLKSAAQLSEPDRNAIYTLLSRIAVMLFPVLECNQYRDYKAYDRELIEAIPFILTGRNAITICLPLGEASCAKSNNDDFFKSVASATALYAERIIYLYVYEYTTHMGIFASKLKGISNYMEYRGRKCHISIKVLVPETEYKARGELEKTLQRAKQKKYIRDYELIIHTDTEDISQVILQHLEGERIDYYDGTNSLSGSSLTNARVTEAMLKNYSYFEFDSYNKLFRNCVGCEELQYVRLSSFIRIEDMFSLLNARDKQFTYRDYADSYMDYWQIYCGEAIGESNFALCARSWTKVSDILKTGGQNCLHINGASLNASDNQEERVVRKMLQALQTKQFLSNLQISRDNKVTVKIRDDKVKGMFAKAGDLLETYVYFEACKTGWFDDVQSGYQFRWEFDDVTNELDCVLTKDYRSVLVECKSTKSADEGYYLTLDSLGDHFGIGFKKVLIMVTDTRAKTYGGYVSRGKQMDIITLSSKDDLMNIGRKLIEIMKQ